MSRYRLHTRRQRRLARLLLIVAGIALLGIGIWFGSRSLFKANTSIGNGKAVVSKVVLPKPKIKHIDEPLFTFDLPQDWQQYTQPANNPNHEYGWHSTAGKDAGTRSLVIYVDTLPITMPVNRVLVVQSSGDHMVVQGDVSDNCVDFTQSANVDRFTASMHAKWNGIDFICDVGNSIRDVVGSGSTDGVNTSTLTGPTAGKHGFFFVYTDNSPQPDYSIFTTALNTFRVK